MARNNTKRKTAKKRIKGAANNPVRSEARPPRREDSERVAAARRIYADEESILKADAADEGVDGTGKRPAVHESNSTKRAKKKAAGSRPAGKTKNRRSGKPEAGRTESAGAKDRKSGKPVAGRAESAGVKDRKSGKSEAGRAESAGTKDRKSGKPEAGRAESAGAKDRKSGKPEAGRTESAGANPRKRGESGTSSEKTESGTLKISRPHSESSEETGESAAGTNTGKKKPEKSGNSKRKTEKSAKANKAERPAAGTKSRKPSEKRSGMAAAVRKPFKMPSGEALIREFRQAVHFDKKVFAGMLCAVVIVSIILINITELEGISHLPLTDVSAGHDALANQMMKDLTVQTQSITDIEDAERAAEEEAMRAQMDAEAYEAQLAAEQAAYDAAHGDESDLYTTMEVRDPDELRSTLVENNAYAIGDSMIEGMNDGQYVNTENLIFRRGCGTYDSLELFERAVNLQASVVWVQLGLNDMDMYISDVGQFKDNYRKLVLYLQENLPDCRIFLCNINPISPDACRRHPQYEYAGQYNQAIMELCEELGVTYVDNTTLVLGHPELWDTDGIHPVQDVYLWMLSHMCYEAGI